MTSTTTTQYDDLPPTSTPRASVSCEGLSFPDTSSIDDDFTDASVSSLRPCFDSEASASESKQERNERFSSKSPRGISPRPIELKATNADDVDNLPSDSECVTWAWTQVLCLPKFACNFEASISNYKKTISITVPQFASGEFAILPWKE